MVLGVALFDLNSLFVNRYLYFGVLFRQHMFYVVKNDLFSPDLCIVPPLSLAHLKAKVSVIHPIEWDPLFPSVSAHVCQLSPAVP